MLCREGPCIGEKTRPAEDKNGGGKLYDFTNLRFYDFPTWLGNLRARKKERRCDWEFGFMEFRTPFPAWGARKDTSKRA